MYSLICIFNIYDENNAKRLHLSVFSKKSSKKIAICIQKSLRDSLYFNFPVHVNTILNCGFPIRFSIVLLTG